MAAACTADRTGVTDRQAKILKVFWAIWLLQKVKYYSGIIQLEVHHKLDIWNDVTVKSKHENIIIPMAYVIV